MTVSDRIMQEYEHSDGAPHAYIYAVEIIMHCVRLTACTYSRSEGSEFSERMKALQQRRRDALQQFCTVLRRRQTSATPLIRTSDYLDGALLGSLPVVLQAIAEYLPTTEGVAAVLKQLTVSIDAALARA